MTDPDPDRLAAAKKIAGQMSVDQMLGLDTQRMWATGAQAFVNPDFTMLVFREQNILNFEDSPQHDGQLSIRNVGSVVMPTPVAKELLGILQAQMQRLPGGEG